MDNYTATTSPSNGTLAPLDAVLAELRALRARNESIQASLDRLIEKTYSPDAVLTTLQLAEHLGITERTISRWRELGVPRLQRGANFVRYRLSDVLAWLEGRNPKRKPR